MTRTALITGSEGGIGEALCQKFKVEGFKVIGLDLEQRSADHDVFVLCDLMRFCQDDSYRAGVLAEIHSHCAENRLKVLINNAALQILKPTEELHADDWTRTLNVNVVAPFLLAQGLLANLAADAGAVINIASVHAHATKPGFVCYATSKAALVGLTKAMAVDLGPRVRVNALCPAATATPMLQASFAGNPEAFEQLSHMHPRGRIAEPSEIADIVFFLASSQADFLTGTSLYADGGICARLHDPL
jgi:NAD(P)-dependent dehydrogenase (short-subunit alcohol dehydrogenase family)